MKFKNFFKYSNYRKITKIYALKRLKQDPKINKLRTLLKLLECQPVTEKKKISNTSTPEPKPLAILDLIF